MQSNPLVSITTGLRVLLFPYYSPGPFRNCYPGVREREKSLLSYDLCTMLFPCLAKYDEFHVSCCANL
jgi:hypothetical protein